MRTYKDCYGNKVVEQEVSKHAMLTESDVEQLPTPTLKFFSVLAAESHDYDVMRLCMQEIELRKIREEACCYNAKDLFELLD